MKALSYVLFTDRDIVVARSNLHSYKGTMFGLWEAAPALQFSELQALLMCPLGLFREEWR